MRISDSAALEAYEKLHSIANSLGPLSEAAEGTASHLCDHVSRKIQDARSRLENEFSSQFEKVLKSVSWPKPDVDMPASLRASFAEHLSKLLRLQKPELERHEHSRIPNTHPSSQILLPLTVMVRPLELGFRYHFSGDRATNRVDRPEYFLMHVTQRLLPEYNDFIVEYVQPVLCQHFRGQNLASNPAYIDGTSAFITALLPMVQSKLSETVPQCINHPQLLSHLIKEVLSFDSILRDEWNYEGFFGTGVWKGLAWEMLNRDDVFSRWLTIEKDCKSFDSIHCIHSV